MHRYGWGPVTPECLTGLEPATSTLARWRATRYTSSTREAITGPRPSDLYPVPQGVVSVFVYRRVRADGIEPEPGIEPGLSSYQDEALPLC